MKMIITSLTMALALLSAQPVLADEGPIISRMEALVVSRDAKGAESVKAADAVEPGQLIEYRLSYENITDQPHRNLVVTSPVPVGTDYVPASAGASVESVLTVSIDGGSQFQPEPVSREVRGADGIMRTEVVPASEYTHLRWRSNERLAARSTQKFHYRVIVE